MQRFKLDPQLEKDCHILGQLEGQYLLLLDNALLPWFILVPETDVTELYQLNSREQQLLNDNINYLSAFINKHYRVDKLNVAAIGNVVSQLHMHVIGRNRDDYCWPGVVWGRPEKEKYSSEEVGSVKALLTTYFPQVFVPIR